MIVFAATILALRLLQRGEQQAEQLGWMPTAEGEILAPAITYQDFSAV